MSPWDAATLQARVSDPARRTRHVAASPDPTEVAAYADALTGVPARTAVVLGMTPELRAMAATRFEHVAAVDVNPAAIALYGPWVDGTTETVVDGDWLELEAHVPEPVDAVLGDGVFGNLPDLAAHRCLLDAIAAVLRPGGVLVTRQAIVPTAYDRAADGAAGLLARHRRGTLDPAEFGFGVRILGHRACCYDEDAQRLHNRPLFAEVAAQHARGELTDAEHAAIVRYAFDGENALLREEAWETLLRDSGWEFTRAPLSGRDWYRYYPVYRCRPA